MQRLSSGMDAGLISRSLLVVALICASPAWSQAGIAQGQSAQAPSEEVQAAAELNDRAQELYRTGRYAEAEPLYQRSLALREKIFGPMHAEVATSLNNLGLLYRAQGRYAEAESSYKRSLAMREQLFGAAHPEVAAVRNNLGRVYQDQGHYAQAQQFYQQALSIREQALGLNHPDVASSLNDMASLLWELGRYAEAEPLFKRSLAIREQALGAKHPEVAQSCNNLGLLYWNQARFAEAEPLLQRGLTIRELALGPDHPDVAVSLNNLALLFYSQGQYAQAETLYRRALAIREKAFGANHVIVGLTLNNLARLYGDQGRYAEAEPLYRRSLTIREAALGPNHPDIATTLNSLGLLYDAQGRYAAAEPLFLRALKIRETAFGPGHPYVAHVLNNLAQLYEHAGRYTQAEPLYQRALSIRETTLGAEHPDLTIILDNLARLYARQHRFEQALRYSTRGYEILRKRFTQASGMRAGQLAEQQSKRAYFARHVALLQRARRADAASFAFEAAQLAQASSVGQSVAQMAARFAVQGDALALAIRAQQDTADRLAHTDKALIDAIGQPPQKQNPAQVAALRQTLGELDSALATQTKNISERFPEYDSLVSAAPISVREAQQLLRPNEALLFYLIDAQGSFAWVVRPHRIDFRRLNITRQDLERRVRALRARLDPQQNSDLLPYDAAAAHALYQKIFAPLEPALKGVQHVIQINDGALQSLPFAVLVSKAPSHHDKPVWLTERFAFSVVPSVSALRALRSFSRAQAKVQAREQAFIGFGNPVLLGFHGSQRGLVARALFTQAALGVTSGIADVNEIRQASPLPDTALELKALATTLKASDASLHLQQDASERAVKSLDLSRYRVLAFATHGVMAGELSGVAEPGLILTPPPQGTLQDDGYLSASEVAQLKLNADWVLLSACNTSAPDGTPGAEGLSGLAKGFFYAGARSLLVSNWYVVSDAAVRITTEMLKDYTAKPELGKAEALRQAMRKLRNDPRYAQPLFWAPFVVVGEGGAG